VAEQRVRSAILADMLSSTAPTTHEGIEKYLGSGMVKGIGPIYAKKLVDRFGEQIFEIIENESAEELTAVGEGEGSGGGLTAHSSIVISALSAPQAKEPGFSRVN
jgi:hypothetical protein